LPGSIDWVALEWLLIGTLCVVILKQELTDRSAVMAGVLGLGAGLALAVADTLAGASASWLVIPTIFGVAAWLLRVGWIGVARMRKLRTLSELWSQVEPGTPEWRLFERAWMAVTRLDRITRRRLPSPVASRVREHASAAVQQLYSLAGEASELARRAAQIDGPRLAAEADQLRARRVSLTGESAAAVDRSLAALSDATAVLDRLRAAREVALDRVAAGVHAIEGIHARVIELAILLRTSYSPPAALDALTDELEGLRRGLHEATETSRATLAELPRQPDIASFDG
jgi:hypothetical protein